MTRKPITWDDVDEVEVVAANRGRPDTAKHVAAAETYESWSGEPHGRDEVTRADLLVAAGEQWVLAGDHERALATFRNAVADGSPTEIDARAFLHGQLVATRQEAEAAELARALMRERPRDPSVYALVGESYELAGRLDEAIAWFTSGMLRLIDDDEVAEGEVMALAVARRRVRRASGLPADEYDEMAEEYQIEVGQFGVLDDLA